MGEHNSEENKLDGKLREIMRMTEEDKKFAKEISEFHKVTEVEAQNRVQMIKKLAFTHAKKLGHEKFMVLVEMIANGSIIPTNTVFDFDKPLSAFLIMFDSHAIEQEKLGKKSVRMDMTVNFFGNEYEVCVMRKKDYDSEVRKSETK